MATLLTSFHIISQNYPGLAKIYKKIVGNLGLENPLT